MATPIYKLEPNVWEAFEEYRRQFGNLKAVRLAREILTAIETLSAFPL